MCSVCEIEGKQFHKVKEMNFQGSSEFLSETYVKNRHQKLRRIYFYEEIVSGFDLKDKK